MPPPDLEHQISALLRGQPPRAAPATLETRVLAAIAAQERAPWWQRSFAQWPLAPRAGFLAICLSLAWLTVAGLMWITQTLRSAPLPPALAQALTWAHVAAGLGSAAGDTTAAVLHSIPAGWLEAAAAFGLTLYLALFAAGAMAYRALCANR